MDKGETLDYQPRPRLREEKKRRNRLIKMAESQADWAYSFQDETWWSRFSHPDLHSWVENGQFTKLVEQVYTKNDPDPKALACFGLLVRWKNDKAQIKEKIWLRFVEGNPCSDLTIKYLHWTCSKAHQSGKRVLVMFWDHAPWHISKETMDWVHAHNRQVKQSGNGVRLLICFLPHLPWRAAPGKKSPWLNSIEPMWIHAKRKIVEPNRKLSAKLGATNEQSQKKLAETVEKHGGVIFGLDGLQPEGCGSLLYVLYEVLGGTVVGAIQVEKVSAEQLAEWMQTYQKYPVLATLSDGEDTLIAALKKTWPGVPHQRCQEHFLGNVAEEVLNYDTQLRQARSVRQSLGGLPKVEPSSPLF